MPVNSGDPANTVLPEERIAAVAAARAAELDPSKIIGAILDGVRLALEADHVFLLVAQADGSLSPAGAAGRAAAPPLPRDIVARASSARDPQFIDDSAPGALALALVPLVAGGTRVGALAAA